MDPFESFIAGLITGVAAQVGLAVELTGPGPHGLPTVVVSGGGPTAVRITLETVAR